MELVVVVADVRVEARVVDDVLDLLASARRSAPAAPAARPAPPSFAASSTTVFRSSSARVTSSLPETCVVSTPATSSSPSSSASTTQSRAVTPKSDRSRPPSRLRLAATWRLSAGHGLAADLVVGPLEADERAVAGRGEARVEALVLRAHRDVPVDARDLGVARRSRRGRSSDTSIGSSSCSTPSSSTSMSSFTSAEPIGLSNALSSRSVTDFLSSPPQPATRPPASSAGRSSAARRRSGAEHGGQATRTAPMHPQLPTALDPLKTEMLIPLMAAILLLCASRARLRGRQRARGRGRPDRGALGPRT